MTCTSVVFWKINDCIVYNLYIAILIKYTHAQLAICTLFFRAEPTIVIFPANMSVTEGEQVYLEVEIKGHPPTLTWYHNGVVARTDDHKEIDEKGGILFAKL